MTLRHDARGYLLSGMSPQQIAKRMGRDLKQIREYLFFLVGEGELFHSDIAFSIPERKLIEEAARNVPPDDEPYKFFRMRWDVCFKLREQGHDIDFELIHLYLAARDPRPDLYSLLCKIELLLHHLVKQTLQAAYGDNWWRKGISEAIRKNCQSRREEDDLPLEDPYCYTTFIDLKAIIENGWRIFSIALPKTLAADKPDTLRKLKRLNDVRNVVMHPVKQVSEYEDDYRFARKCLEEFDGPRWRVMEAQSVHPFPANTMPTDGPSVTPETI